MKKTGIILTSTIIAAMISSCQKTYTCECTEVTEVTDSTGAKTTFTDKYSFTYHAKKKYSDEACLNMVGPHAKPSSTTSGGGGAEVTGGSIACQVK